MPKQPGTYGPHKKLSLTAEFKSFGGDLQFLKYIDLASLKRYGSGKDQRPRLTKTLKKARKTFRQLRSILEELGNSEDDLREWEKTTSILIWVAMMSEQVFKGSPKCGSVISHPEWHFAMVALAPYTAFVSSDGRPKWTWICSFMQSEIGSAPSKPQTWFKKNLCPIPDSTPWAYKNQLASWALKFCEWSLLKSLGNLPVKKKISGPTKPTDWHSLRPLHKKRLRVTESNYIRILLKLIPRMATKTIIESMRKTNTRRRWLKQGGR